MKSLSNNKAPGSDEIQIEIIRERGEQGERVITYNDMGHKKNGLRKRKSQCMYQYQRPETRFYVRTTRQLPLFPIPAN